MKLYTTTKSERGKEVTKGGNEYINFSLINEKREEVARLESVYKDGIIKLFLSYNTALCKFDSLDIQDIPY